MAELTLPKAPAFDVDQSPRQWLPEPDDLVGGLRELMTRGEPEGLGELAAGLSAPVTDLTVTALTARATLLAAEHGRAFYHHELRRRLAMPEHLEPEISVWEAGTVPAWADGVLAEPKYFSFFQDAPFPAYNPNHRRKWRAHELLHGASRFFWHPEMTRFEFYVSARLNELLPVVHWYHLDEIFRPRCKEHEDQVLHRDHCLECQEVATSYWNSDAPEQTHRVEAAREHVEGAWRHFEEEWEAISAEIETGRRHGTPRPRLDASSDAIGYMRAHWSRATAWSFGHWVETFLEDGVDYYSTLGGLRENVGRSTHRLVSGTIDVTTEHFAARRTRSQLQDLGYRALLALEWLDPDTKNGRTAEASLMPALEDCAEVAQDLLEDPDAIGAGLDQFARTCQVFSTIAPRFPDEIADAFMAFGYRFIDPHVFAGAGIGQVFTGLEDGVPETAARIEDPVDVTRQFILSDTFDELGRLSGRFATWVTDTEHSSTLKETARFEAFANAEPRTDQEATHFAALPERAGALREARGILRPHKTLRRAHFDAQLLGDITGEKLDAAGSLAVAASLVDGDLRLVIEDEFTRRVLNHVCNHEPIDEWWDFGLAEAIMQLLENSIITWLPAPRRNPDDN